ncbi:hypothetical protein HY230_00645 [Candidatus Acetothermia bacterium]|nr:hypothetical protein [Candidatus Acetothermia bacterium]
MAVRQSQVLSPSNETVDFLLEEFEEACEQTLHILQQLKKTSYQDPIHEDLEGAFYAALLDLRDHTRDLVKAWDKLTDSLPDEE